MDFIPHILYIEVYLFALVSSAGHHLFLTSRLIENRAKVVTYSTHIRQQNIGTGLHAHLTYIWYAFASCLIL